MSTLVHGRPSLRHSWAEPCIKQYLYIVQEEEVQMQTSNTSPTQHSQLGSASNKSSPQQRPDKLQLSPEGSKDQLKQPSIYLDTSLHHKIIFDASEIKPIDQEQVDQQDVCPLDESVEQQAQSVSPDTIGSPEKEEEKDDMSTSSSSDDNKPQPWELVGDRYAPIRIEHVSILN